MLAEYALNDRVLRHLSPAEVPGLLFRHPPNAGDIRIRCECGADKSPPWTTRLPYEIGSRDSDDDAIEIQGGITLNCNSCGRDVDFKFPGSPSKNSHVAMYGDESNQWFGNKFGFFYCYALVAFEKNAELALKSKLDDLKRVLRPTISPDEWPLHIYDLRNIEWRSKNNIDLGIETINNHIFSLATYIGGIAEKRIIVTALPPIETALYPTTQRPQDYIRQFALTCALYHSTYHMTREGFHISHILEAQSDDHKKNGIDYFAEKTARGLRYDLGYHWSSHQKFVGLPITAPKNSYWQLQIADIVAFMVRRYFYKVNLGHESELPLEALGSVRWASPDRGMLRSATSIGFPWDIFWPDVIRGPNFYELMFQDH